ncbi:unnamed protein product [Brachionus calyciflorus]|uniref:Matrin-type domain-containing protein n=1 Tax=Brachionus calyciflorus TaxID=104777 RepID=A0A814C2B5_9BILA|nr:unnamed protein product [Brachionus calyciflorus]
MSSLTRPEDHRRKWDTEEYEKESQKRELEDDEDEVAPKPKRELLKARDYKIDLDSKLGKTVIVSKATPPNQAGGYYCNICDCVVKDSINFLDHINGRKHQKNLGMSMKIERSTVDQVKKRFELNKKKLEEKKKQYDFEERMKELKEEEEKAKAYRKEKKKQKKLKNGEDNDEEEGEGGADAETDLASIMGFSGFGTSKKN